MAIDRRYLLQLMAATSALPLAPAIAGAEAHGLYAAALRERDGTFGAAIFSLEQGILSKVTTPSRGHSCLGRPGTRECLVFARRPGTFAISFRVKSVAKPAVFTSAEGRHFYGHGAFSPDGRLLFATENDYEGRRGVIGVRDATDGYRQIGEFDSGGIGPHDIAMLPDGQTLVVANGGLETHPDYGREMLNLATMAPNLAYIDVETGDLLERHELPKELHRLSIRHLSVADGGSVVFGCQHKGAKSKQPSLIGFHERGRKLKLAEIPGDANARLRGYVGSISTDRSGTIAAATSPRGGVALYLDVPGKRFLGINVFADASGIAARKTGPGFVLTSGTGRLAQARHDGLVPLSENAFAWDNHVTAIA